MSKIAELNDTFRQSCPNKHLGTVVITGLVQALGNEIVELLNLIRTFDQFTPETKSYDEHNFGYVTY